MRFRDHADISNTKYQNNKLVMVKCQYCHHDFKDVYPGDNSECTLWRSQDAFSCSADKLYFCNPICNVEWIVYVQKRKLLSIDREPIALWYKQQQNGNIAQIERNLDYIASLTGILWPESESELSGFESSTVSTTESIDPSNESSKRWR